MRRESCIFSREDAALVGDKLLEQSDVFVFQGVKRKIDFRLGAGGSDFGCARLAAPAAADWFFGVCFTRHKAI